MSHTGYTSTDYNTSVVGNLIARFVLFTESGKPGDQLRQPPSLWTKVLIYIFEGGSDGIKQFEEFRSSELATTMADDADRSSHLDGLGSMHTFAADTLRSGVDPREIKGIENVVVWYAAEDQDCPPSHGKWLANHFRCSDREGAVRVDPGGHFSAGGPTEEYLDVLLRN